MAFSIYGGTTSAVKQQSALSGAEAAGAAIGTGIGAMFLVIIWLVGAVILGIMAMLTRAK